MSQLILGIDVGTTGTKCLLLDTGGRVISEAYQNYPLSRPASLHVEQDATLWWEAVKQTVKECVRNVDAADVVTLSVSAQGGAVVAVDENGVPMAPARSWLDRRAVEAEAELERIFTKRGIYERTGWRLYSAYNCAQLLDMRRNQPDLFAQARYFFATADYINFQLTGKAVIDRNSAGITQLMDVRTQEWDEEILEAIGIDMKKLPALVSSGVPIGTLTDRAAVALGLSSSVQVVAGGHDQYCAALGAGITGVGHVLISTGTAWVVLGTMNELQPDPRTNFGVGVHVLASKFGAFGSFRNGGVCLDWIRTVLGVNGQPLPYKDVQTSAERVSPGSDGLLFFPHFDGTNIPHWSDRSSGTFIGLELRHSSDHMLRAVMEGVCFELRAVFETYIETYPPVNRIRVLGGAANSPIWIQMLADVLGRQIEVPKVVHSACIGAAILAGVGSGLFIDATHGFESLNIDIQLWDPTENVSTYDHNYSRYVAFSRALNVAYETIESDEPNDRSTTE